MLKLYGTRMSRAARSMWALEELGLEYEHVPLNTQGDSRVRTGLTAGGNRIRTIGPA